MSPRGRGVISRDNARASRQETGDGQLGHLSKDKQEACGLPLWPVWAQPLCFNLPKAGHPQLLPASFPGSSWLRKPQEKQSDRQHLPTFCAQSLLGSVLSRQHLMGPHHRPTGPALRGPHERTSQSRKRRPNTAPGHPACNLGLFEL